MGDQGTRNTEVSYPVNDLVLSEVGGVKSCALLVSEESMQRVRVDSDVLGVGTVDGEEEAEFSTSLVEHSVGVVYEQQAAPPIVPNSPNGVDEAPYFRVGKTMGRPSACFQRRFRHAFCGGVNYGFVCGVRSEVKDERGKSQGVLRG